MKNKLFVVGGGILVLALMVWLGLPRLLNTLGLHGHYEIPPGYAQPGAQPGLTIPTY